MLSDREIREIEERTVARGVIRDPIIAGIL